MDGINEELLAQLDKQVKTDIFVLILDYAIQKGKELELTMAEMGDVLRKKFPNREGD